MTDRELDQLLRRVLVDAIAQEQGGYEDPAAAFEPSRQHQRQIGSMLKDPLGWAKRRTAPLRKTVLKRVAAIFLVCSIGFGGILWASPAAQATMRRWFVEWYESGIVYRYSGANIAGDLPQYEIIDLPEGYQRAKQTEDPPLRLVEYENADGDLICLLYTYMQQGIANHFILRDDTTVNVTINGLDGLLFVPPDAEDAKMVTWIDPDVNFQFTVTANLDAAELLRLAESVQLIK